ncbi:MAG TPA: EamA family transporter [Bryobacteraceae bacterium]|nr:EamA family transporter [Bryobacteraceae bacterium]
MRPLAWLLLLTMVGATVTGDLLQSMEMKRQGEVCFRNGRLASALSSMARNAWLALAIVFMAISFFAFLKLLTVADLSFAVPASAASFVLETILARLVLKERINLRRWAGAALVAGGVALLAL